jgi:hypothetical protein
VRSINQNLSLLERLIEELEPFLFSSQVFWPLTQRETRNAPLPWLTLGGLLITLNEVAAQNSSMNSKQAMQHDRLLQKLEGIRAKWQSTIEKRAMQELKARLNLWRGYKQDLEDKPEWIENYPQEVRNRVMIDLLIASIGHKETLESERQQIRDLDHQIHEYLIPGEFIWEDSLQPFYPHDEFPYLYMQPQGFFNH